MEDQIVTRVLAEAARIEGSTQALATRLKAPESLLAQLASVSVARGRENIARSAERVGTWTTPAQRAPRDETGSGDER